MQGLPRDCPGIAQGLPRACVNHQPARQFPRETLSKRCLLPAQRKQNPSKKSSCKLAHTHVRNMPGSKLLAVLAKQFLEGFGSEWFPVDVEGSIEHSWSLGDSSWKVCKTFLSSRLFPYISCTISIFGTKCLRSGMTCVLVTCPCPDISSIIFVPKPGWYPFLWNYTVGRACGFFNQQRCGYSAEKKMLGWKPLRFHIEWLLILVSPLDFRNAVKRLFQKFPSQQRKLTVWDGIIIGMYCIRCMNNPIPRSY